MITQLLSLMKAYGIRHVVVCPGSRNAPLVHAFASRPDCFKVHPITDERSAGFVAIGMADALQSPVAVCVTSGSAVLNVAPAVAEAFYRRVPLLVVSADRPAQWIGQMDGQTLPQNGSFGTLARSYQLPADGADARWWRNRLINEALASLQNKRPMHINVPLSEPLFDFPSNEKYIDDDERKVEFERGERFELSQSAVDEWISAKRRMIIVGQHYQNERLRKVIAEIRQKNLAVIIAESLSNLPKSCISNNYNDFIGTENPDLVVYLGGHIILKKVKKYLRKQNINKIWRIESADEQTFIDTFQHTTRVIYSADEVSVLEQLTHLQADASQTSFIQSWTSDPSNNNFDNTETFDAQTVAAYALHRLAELPHRSAVALANSSTVRYAQHVAADYVGSCNVLCNRGVNGIEGTLSAAVGYATIKSEELVLCIIGDLSYFYDHNALWNNNLPQNLRIILLNDGGGKIFSGLNGLEASPFRETLIAAQHNYQTSGWAADCGIAYYKSNNNAINCKSTISNLLTHNNGRAALLEVML